MLSFLYELTGHYAIGYMALSQVAATNLLITVGLFYREKLGEVHHQLHEMKRAVIDGDATELGKAKLSS